MQLKSNVGPEFIMAREEAIMNVVRERVKSMENLVILGNMDVPKLPILSFLIRVPSRLGQGFLHHNFICFILNDVFGIQVSHSIQQRIPFFIMKFFRQEEAALVLDHMLKNCWGFQIPF